MFESIENLVEIASINYRDGHFSESYLTYF